MKNKQRDHRFILTSDLPVIPSKRYFTIKEASILCGVKAHVLRYWEQVFSQLNPSKRRGNRRYYQREDVLMVRHIRRLLYEQGFTINGARDQLYKKSHINKEERPVEVVPPIMSTINSEDNITEIVQALETVLEELQV